MYKCVIFDMDGTVLNTLDDLADAGNHALSVMRLSTFPVPRYRYFVGNGIPRLIQRILRENAADERYDEAYKLFCSYYGKHMNDKTVPYDGIPEVLDELKGAGMKLVLISNKAHEFAVEIAKKAFGDVFDIIYGSFDDKPKKPDPYFVNEALKRLNIKSDEAFYVGDTSVDIQTAKNAGVTSCGVLWGFRDREELEAAGADFICSESRGLLPLIIK